MADKGKDPLPVFKKSISLTKNNKNMKYFGRVQERLIIIFKQNKLDAILSQCLQK